MVLAIFFVILFPVLVSASHQTPTITHRYKPHFEIDTAKYFNQNARASGAINLFIPLFQNNNNLFFTDLRLFNRTSGSFEGNFHFGFRNLWNNKIFGLYAAYDRKRSEKGNNFNQLTLGFEHWNNNWFIGGNLYEPIGQNSKFLGSTQTQSWAIDDISISETITTASFYEKALPGADAEFGYSITNNLISYLGGYYFSSSDTGSTAGAKLRLTYDYQKPTGRILNILDGIGLETGAAHDHKRGTTAYLAVKFRIGLGEYQDISGFERHMIDLVRRDPDIVTDKTSLKNTETKTKKIAEIICKIKEVVDPIETIFSEEALERVFEGAYFNCVLINEELYHMIYNMINDKFGIWQDEIYRELLQKRPDEQPSNKPKYNPDFPIFSNMASNNFLKKSFVIKDFLIKIMNGDFLNNIKEEARNLFITLERTDNIEPYQLAIADKLFTCAIYKGAEDMLQGKPKRQLFGGPDAFIPQFDESRISWVVERGLNISSTLKILEKAYDLEINEKDFANFPEYVPFKTSLSTLKHVGIQLGDADRTIISYNDKSMVRSIDKNTNTKEDSVTYYNRRKISDDFEVGFDTGKINQILISIRSQWDRDINVRVEEYNWLNHNCKHFIAAAIKEYIDRNYPVYIKTT